MRYLLILILFVACNTTRPENNLQVNTRVDTLKVADTIYISKCDTILKQNDSLKKALFRSNYAIEKVRFYIKVVDKKPSNIKYLKGWINRAVN